MDAKEMLTETPGSNGHWLLTNRQELLTEHGVDSMHTLYLIDIILSVSGSAMAFGRTISGKTVDVLVPGTGQLASLQISAPFPRTQLLRSDSTPQGCVITCSG